MDFNKLKTFLIVAEEQSVTRAAKRLFVTQSAVTQALQGLEEELGLALLQRRNARIYLTPEGQSIFQAVGRAYSTVEAHIGQLTEDTRLLSGLIRVAVVANFGSHYVIDSLRTFRKLHPSIFFQLEYVGSSMAVEDKLLNNEVDLGVLVQFRDKKLFEILPLDEHLYQLVASPRLRAPTGVAWTLQTVMESAPLIDFSPDFISLRPWLDRNGRSRVAEIGTRRPSIVVQNQADARDLVLQGLGMAVLPNRLTGHELERGKLVHAVRNTKPIPVGFDLALRKKRSSRVIVDLYVEHLTCFVRAQGPPLRPGREAAVRENASR